MLLKNLNIHRVEYGENKGQFEGQAEFDGAASTVGVNLDNEKCRKILDVCSEAILDTAKEAAQATRAELLECQPLLDQV